MMDKREFLESGLMEQYALRLTTPEEEELVEHFATIYPDIRAELKNLQTSLELYAEQYAVKPPRRLKKSILGEINSENKRIPHKPSSHPALHRSLFFIVLLLLGLSGYMFWQQRQSQQQAFLVAKKLEAQSIVSKEWLPLLSHRDTREIRLQGTTIASYAHAVAYWNATAQRACIKFLEMPALPDGKQYHLWADVNGEMISLGALKAEEQCIQKITFLENAASLNVTMEPQSGSVHPSVYLLIVNGKI